MEYHSWFVHSLSGDYSFRVGDSFTVLSSAELRLAERVAHDFRFGLEARDSDVARFAEVLLRALGRWDDLALWLAPRTENAARDQALAAALSEALHSGKLRVKARTVQSVAQLPPIELPSLAVPRQPKEPDTTFFDVRLLDEAGQAIPGVPLAFDFGGGLVQVTTNAAGVALLEDVTQATAHVSIREVEDLNQTLEQRWSKPRRPAAHREGNTVELTFENKPIGPVSVKAAIPHTIVLKPAAQLIISVHVGKYRGAKDALAVIDSKGKEISRILIKDLPMNQDGFIHWELDAAQFPADGSVREFFYPDTEADPSFGEEVSLLTDCSLKQLHSTLRSEAYEEAGRTGYAVA